MTPSELSTMLGAAKPPEEVLLWLRTTYLPALIDEFNQESCRKRLGLYQGEVIPRNERNLTDVRTRVGLIIEYEIARLSNQILEAAGVDDLFWAYVVSNRFPDLEVRRPNGDRRLRLEIKCLQSIAEEKAANFDTLKKDINPNTDFVLVLVWEWGYADGRQFNWDRAPRILNAHVFHAMSLAELRDAFWLNRPPDDLGGGYQGFDLRYAVNCADGDYAEEEHNYGKLMRIWQAGFEYRPPPTLLIDDTEAAYLQFRKDVIADGFRSLCNSLLPQLSGTNSIATLEFNGNSIGAMSGSFGFFAKSAVGQDKVGTLMKERDLAYAVAMTDKYVCTGFRRDGTRARQIFANKKPKTLSRLLFGLA